MTSDTSDFKPFKVSQMFSLRICTLPGRPCYSDSIQLTFQIWGKESHHQARSQSRELLFHPFRYRWGQTHSYCQKFHEFDDWMINWLIHRSIWRLHDWVIFCCFKLMTQVFCFMTAVVTLLVNDPVTREQRNTTVAVLGKGSSFGVRQYFVT